MNSTDDDRFDGPEGVDFPRFSRRIVTLGQLTRSSAAVGRPEIGVLRPFRGVLQPETATDGRPLPKLSYLTLRPVADRIVERERSVGVEETQPDLDSPRDALEETDSAADPDPVASASREPDSRADAGSPTDAEPIVREALRESGGSDSSDTGPTSRDSQGGDRDVRTLEPDSPSQLRRTISSRQANDNRTRSMDPADSVATADTNRSATSDRSSDADDVSAKLTQSSRSATTDNDPAVGRQSGPPPDVESTGADRGASRAGSVSRSDRSDTPAPTLGAHPGDERESHTVRGSGRGERVRFPRSSPGEGTYPTLRLREGDGSSDRANGIADSEGFTHTRSQDPSEGSDTVDQPSTSRDRDPVTFPSDLSLDDEDASRFVDALYRELERRARIERDRRGL